MRRMRRLAAIAAAILVLGTSTSQGGAQTGPLMRAIALPPLAPALAAQLAPITIELPAGRTDLAPPQVRIVGLTWCGGDGADGARALGVAYPEEAIAPSSNLLSSADCEREPSSIAQRIPLSAVHGPWTVVIKLRATWRPWRMTLAILDAAGAGANNPAAALRGLGEIKSIATAGLQVLPPPGDRYRFDLAIKFTRTTIVAALFPAGAVADPDRYMMNGPMLTAEQATAPSSANLVADAQYWFINQMLRLYAPVYEVPFQLQGMNQPMTVRNVTMSGGDNTMTLRGEIGYAGLIYNGAMVAQGEDLRIASIGLDPGNLPDCNMDDMIVRLQCQGNQVAITSSARALAAALTNYYQGQMFHYSTGERPLRFVLGDVEFAADLAALQSASHGAIFSEAGRAAIRRLGTVGESDSAMAPRAGFEPAT
jgi:hypothetical protein